MQTAPILKTTSSTQDCSEVLRLLNYYALVIPQCNSDFLVFMFIKRTNGTTQ